MPQNARPAAQRGPLPRRALLPALLLLTVAGGLGAVAGLPAPAELRGREASSRVGPPDGVRMHALTLGADVTAERGPTRADAAADAAQAVRSRERASRTRTRPAAATSAAARTAVAGTRPAVRSAAGATAAAPAVAAAARRPAPRAFARPGVGALTSTYGPRWGRLHAGIDLASGTGSPISAVAAGTVLSAGDEGGYGLCVRVQHPAGTVSLYAHLSRILVTKGQPVQAGTPLGLEGNSGNSTGPHLHFEVRVGGRPVDPLTWLRARGIDPAKR